MEENYLLSIFVAAIWSAVFLLCAWKKGFFVLPGRMEKSVRPLTSVSVLFAFFIFLGVHLAFALLFSHSIWKDPVSIIASGLALWVYLDYWPQIKRTVWGTSTFISRQQSLYNLGFGAMSWFVCYPIVMLVNQIISFFILIFSQKPPKDQLAVELMKGYLDNPYQFWIMAFLIVVVAPAIEEVLFRGFLQNLLKQFLGFKKSLVITSIIFALFHYTTGQGVHNIGILSALFVLSLFLGFIYERQNSLIAPIGLHCTFNAFSILLIFYNY